MDPFTAEKLTQVHPELARRVTKFLDLCEQNGLTVHITQGLRTWPQQDALYQQGRTTPGKIVTNAKPGHSAHNMGYAVDVVPGRPGFPQFTPDWDGMDLCWKQVLSLAKQCQLSEGAAWRTFPDEPHLYLEELPADPDDNMRYLFSQGGMQGLWSTWKLNPPEETAT